jgi:5-(carboxyamino)imidazole ribonucleotide mutase
MSSPTPVVAVVMGSDSDLETMRPAVDTLADLAVPAEVRVVSAHRAPFDMVEFGRTAADRGLRVIIAAAGGAAHLPGMLAACTTLPVIGVPVGRPPLAGMDALLSIVQMPTGVPVATVAIDASANAAILAARILALNDADLATRVAAHREGQAQKARSADARLRER